MDVYVGEPAADFGENRYLTHFTSEIVSGGEICGYILFTRYDYSEVEQDKIPFRWLVQPHSYMSTVGSLVIGTQTRFPTLPIEIQESISKEHGHVYILDEVTCTSYHKNKSYFVTAIHQLVSYLKNKTDAVLVSDGETFGQYLSNKKQAPDEFWRQFDIHNVSGRYIYAEDIEYFSENTDLDLFPEPF